MYLDANLFIYAHTNQGKKSEKARQIFQDIVEGKSAMTSALTMDEVMWVFIKNNKKEEIRGMIEEAYATKNLEIKETPASTPLKALELIEKHNLKPRDAFHAATMQHFNQTQIASDDTDFDKIPWIERIPLAKSE